MYFILMSDDTVAKMPGDPYDPDTVLQWALWKQENKDRVKIGDETTSKGVRVSTIFVGHDLEYLPGGPTLLFETAVFRDGKLVEIWGRYTDMVSAKAGHAQAVKEYS